VSATWAWRVRSNRGSNHLPRSPHACSSDSVIVEFTAVAAVNSDRVAQRLGVCGLHRASRGQRRFAWPVDSVIAEFTANSTVNSDRAASDIDACGLYRNSRGQIRSRHSRIGRVRSCRLRQTDRERTPPAGVKGDGTPLYFGLRPLSAFVRKHSDVNQHPGSGCSGPGSVANRTASGQGRAHAVSSAIRGELQPA
jgi:hypothetical protein